MGRNSIYRILLTVLMVWCQTSFSQTGFVHLQSENGQPYYVQWNGYTYSSSGSGYLIIPKMPAGEQTMVIGFAKNQYPEYLFRYTLGENPRAFSLKLNIDNSWSLFDMVSFTIIKAKALTSTAKQEYLKDIERSARAGRNEESNSFKVLAVTDTSGIYKIFDRTTEDGTDLVYVVNNNGVSDTVVIFIPAPAAPPKPAGAGAMEKTLTGRFPELVAGEMWQRKPRRNTGVLL